MEIYSFLDVLGKKNHSSSTTNQQVADSCKLHHSILRSLN